MFRTAFTKFKIFYPVVIGVMYRHTRIPPIVRRAECCRRNCPVIRYIGTVYHLFTTTRKNGGVTELVSRVPSYLNLNSLAWRCKLGLAARGLPTDIYSDCGTNFVEANKKLRALINDPAGQMRASIASGTSIRPAHPILGVCGRPQFGLLNVY